MLTSNDKPDSGKIILGETLKFGYYTQKGIPYKNGQKVIDVIREYGDYIPLKKGHKISAQQLLERFLFDRKKQYDFVDKLSGGERKRLYLCTILIQNPNFLILDEPTNDLDIITLNVLESFLLDFPGCLIVVSHDRYFMDKIVDHLFVFKGSGDIEDFPGNYSDYRTYEDSKIKETTNSIKSENKQTKDLRNNSNQKKTNFNQKKEFKKIEIEIKKIENKKKEIQNRFINESLSVDQIKEYSFKLKNLEEELELKTIKWFELSEN